MAKKKSSEPSLEEQLAAKDRALGVARKALFKIEQVSPIAHTVRGEAGKSSGLGIVRAFNKTQEIAGKAILDMSDAEAPDGVEA